MCSLVQLSMSVVNVSMLSNPLHWLPVSALASSQSTKAATFFLSSKIFRRGSFPDGRRAEQGRSLEGLSLAMAFKQLPFSASETALPPLCNIDPRSTHEARDHCTYISDTFEMRLLSTTGTCPGGRQYRSTPKP